MNNTSDLLLTQGLFRELLPNRRRKPAVEGREPSGLVVALRSAARAVVSSLV